LSPPCPHAKSAPAYTCDRGVYLGHPYITRFVLKYNFRCILRAIFYSHGGSCYKYVFLYIYTNEL